MDQEAAQIAPHLADAAPHPLPKSCIELKRPIGALAAVIVSRTELAATWEDYVPVGML
jgi:hypothetical protein